MQDQHKAIQDGQSNSKFDDMIVFNNDDDQASPYLVAPQYKPLAIYDKKRERRMQHLSQKIKENQRRNLSSKQYG